MIAVYKNDLTDSEMAYVKVSLPLFQEYAQEIEAGKFDKLYEALVGNSVQKSAVTKLLYLSGIDPLADADVIHSYMFFNSDVKSVQLTEGITMIDQGAFRACAELERVHFPASVGSLQFLAFYGCEGLKSVSFAEGNHLELLDSMCFEGCINLSQINFPASLKRIKGAVFRACKSLKEVILPNSLEHIGPDCFNGCASLSKVYIPDSIQSIGQGAFKGCRRLKEIELPSHLRLWRPDEVFPNSCTILRR